MPNDERNDDEHKNVAPGAISPWRSADLDAELRRRQAAARDADPGYDGCRRLAAFFPATLAVMMGTSAVTIAWLTMTRGHWAAGVIGLSIFGSLGILAAGWSRAWWLGKTPFLPKRARQERADRIELLKKETSTE